MLVLGVGGDKAATRGFGAGGALGGLVVLGLGGLCLNSLQEWAQRDGACTTFELAEHADAVIKG